MNENNDYNSTNVRPYKATGNLNTAIGNPSININDAMNVNIQNASTNTQELNIDQNYNNAPQINNQELSVPENNIVNNTINNVNTNTNQTTQNNSYVKKTYVSADNKPKKKKISLNMGPEFKIGLLIIVILLAFVFLLPLLSKLIMGY